MVRKATLCSVLLILAAAAAVMLTACGGSGSDSNKGSGGLTARYGPKSSPAAVSRCMRANGASGFPDPSAGPGGGVGFNGLGEGANGLLIVDGQRFSGPAVKHAEKVCSIYLPPTRPAPKLSAAQRHTMVAEAQCMRHHGVPNFPDPGPNGFTLQNATLNPQAPAFEHAMQACGIRGFQGG